MRLAADVVGQFYSLHFHVEHHRRLVDSPAIVPQPVVIPRSLIIAMATRKIVQSVHT